MATRSLIARHNRDGSFESITVTFGSPNWIGPTLVQHYADEAKISALLALGPLSHLDAEIGAKHSFSQPHPGWCVAYGRDRGEERKGAQRCESVADLMQYARRLFLRHVFVWSLNPQTGVKGWATLSMPEESEETVRALVEEMWERDKRGQTAPFGIAASPEEETP